MVIVQEVERRQIRNLDADAIFRAIRKAVSTEHELQVHAIVLIKPFTLPKTSSGKIQRRDCRVRYLTHNLSVVAQKIGYAHEREQEVLETKAPRLDDILNISDSAARFQMLKTFFRREVAKVLNVPSYSIDPSSPLNELGLDSLLAVELKTRLEAGVGVILSEDALFQAASIHDIVGHINYQLAGKKQNAGHLPLNFNLSSLSQNNLMPPPAHNSINIDEMPVEYYRFEAYPEYLNLQNRFQEMQAHHVENPYFQLYEGINSQTATVKGIKFINFSSYNYLGLCGHPRVSKAAKEAIETYGTSV